MSTIKEQIATQVVEEIRKQLAADPDQRRVARLLGITQTDVSLCKRGKVDTMSLDRLSIILGRLGFDAVVTMTHNPDSDGAKALSEALGREAEEQKKRIAKMDAFIDDFCA